jgi:signal transduction histidine kinase
MTDPRRRTDNGTVNRKDRPGGLGGKSWLGRKSGLNGKGGSGGQGGKGGPGGQMTARVRDWAGQALAFARSAEPQTAPSRRSVAVDAGLAAAALVASTITVIYTSRGQVAMWLSPRGVIIASQGEGFGRVPAAGIFSAVITTAPLALRRIRPLTAFWVVFLGVVFSGQYVNTVTVVVIVLVAYSAVTRSPYRGAALISVPLAALIITVIFPNTAPPLPGRFAALFVLVPVALVGNAVQVWRRRAGDSQARLQRAQADHEAATARVLAAERARIAGELHDVVTHNVSVMVVQAGAARRVLTASPGEATAALLAVEASGRAAMIELQHLLGLLSPVDGMPAQDDVLLQPQPGLDRLRPLIDRVAAAGLPVELTIHGRPRALPPGLDLAGYRVVQEALTNVMKHAGQAQTAVRLDYRPDELIIDVSDDGPVVTAQAGGGRGLLGLRERVSLYGGEFDAGPRSAGGWRVSARLPLGPPPADGADPGPARGSAVAPVPARP